MRVSPMALAIRSGSTSAASSSESPSVVRGADKRAGVRLLMINGVDMVSIGSLAGGSSGTGTLLFLSWREMIHVATPSSTSMTAEKTTVLRTDRARNSAGVVS